MIIITIIVIVESLPRCFAKRSEAEIKYRLLTRSLPLLIHFAHTCLASQDKFQAVVLLVRLVASVVLSFVYLKPKVKAKLSKWLSEKISLDR